MFEASISSRKCKGGGGSQRGGLGLREGRLTEQERGEAGRRRNENDLPTRVQPTRRPILGHKDGRSLSSEEGVKSLPL